MKRALALWAALLSASALGQWTPEESAGIDRLLRLWNFDRKELRIVAPVAPEGRRIAAVERALADPVGSFDAVGEWAQWARQTEDLGLRFFRLLPQAPLKAGLAQVSVQVSPADMPAALPEAAKAPLARAAALVLEAQRLVAQALQPLSENDRAALIRSLPPIAAESGAVPPSPGDARLLQRTEAFDLLDRVVWEVMHQAAARIETACPALVRDLQEAFRAGGPAQPLQFRVGALTVIVGTPRADRHNVPANALCIDPGGDDLYLGHCDRPGRFRSVRSGRNGRRRGAAGRWRPVGRWRPRSAVRPDPHLRRGARGLRHPLEGRRARLVPSRGALLRLWPVRGRVAAGHARRRSVPRGPVR